MGDFIIVINADKVKVTGNKEEDKTYFRHSSYPGGMTQIKLKTILNLHLCYDKLTKIVTQLNKKNFVLKKPKLIRIENI